MRIGWKALVLFLIVVVVALQAVHLALLTRLKYAEQKKPVALVRLVSHQSTSSAMSRLRRQTILDSSGEFLLAKNLVSGDAGMPPRMDVTLVTQCSSDNLLQTWDLLDSWKGPASIAVLLNEEGLKVGLERILALRRCFPSIAANVSFHVISPMRSKALIVPDIDDNPSITCDLIRGGNINKHRNYRLDVRYPVNLLRNVAREAVSTSYFLLVDADMIVSRNARSDFLDFAAKNTRRRQKVVYVLPAFETRSDHEIPRTKASVLASWKKGSTRAFYYGVCSRCHENSGYTNWLKSPPVNETNALFEVMWRDPWEPFYIGKTSSVPLYDERFRQYGFNRISQVCEMHVAGFSFIVLDNAFVVHKGWKTPGDFHPGKDVEQEGNRNLFRVFKNELKSRYGIDSRRCY